MAKTRAKRPPAARQRISILLIDDNRLIREGLAELIRDQPDFRILAATADAEEALLKVKLAKPHVVLLDFGVEGSDAVEVIAGIRREAPEAKIIVMGLSALSGNLSHLVKSGASGFLLKDSSFEMFVNTVRAVAGGPKCCRPS